MKLLLHACCAPCSLEPVDALLEEGHELTLAYFNPNIHPQEEYEHRLSTLTAWAGDVGLSYVCGNYDPEEWERVAGVHGADRPNRCRACYRLRFSHAAEYAKQEGYEGIATTLSVSPYQFTQIIEEELKRAADKAGIVAVFRDYRECYPQATRRSRELGMYRQNFCGCHFSNVEAAQEREERKQARKEAKAARFAAREAAQAHLDALASAEKGSDHEDR